MGDGNFIQESVRDITYSRLGKPVKCVGVGVSVCAYEPVKMNQPCDSFSISQTILTM